MCSPRQQNGKRTAIVNGSSRRSREIPQWLKDAASEFIYTPADEKDFGDIEMRRRLIRIVMRHLKRSHGGVA